MGDRGARERGQDQWWRAAGAAGAGGGRGLGLWVGRDGARSLALLGLSHARHLTLPHLPPFP